MVDYHVFIFAAAKKNCSAFWEKAFCRELDGKKGIASITPKNKNKHKFAINACIL